MRVVEPPEPVAERAAVARKRIEPRDDKDRSGVIETSPNAASAFIEMPLLPRRRARRPRLGYASGGRFSRKRFATRKGSIADMKPRAEKPGSSRNDNVFGHRSIFWISGWPDSSNPASAASRQCGVRQKSMLVMAQRTNRVGAAGFPYGRA